MAMEIEITPGSETFESEDDRWLEQVAGLYDELREEGVPVREESRPVPGAKGDIVTVIAALGSAGAFTAAITVFQAWLSRERTRHIRIRVKVGEEVTEVDFTGDTDSATMERLATELIQHSPGA